MSTSSGSSGSSSPKTAQIALENVCLRFRIYGDSSRHFKQMVLNSVQRRKYGERKEFWLFRSLNLQIERGDRVGIVGPNGAGKTTLLRLISGIYPPTHGRIRVRGRISSLIDLGAGFNTELSGAENILLNGAFLGFSPREMIEKTDRILEFAELQESADTPIKYYSSGMLLRLAFSIATDINPEILLIDEIFGAGDARFIGRATERMHQLLDSSHIVVFVSHNMQVIRDMCTRAVWLEKGAIVQDGPSGEVCDAYLASTAAGQAACGASSS